MSTLHNNTTSRLSKILGIIPNHIRRVYDSDKGINFALQVFYLVVALFITAGVFILLMAGIYVKWVVYNDFDRVQREFNQCMTTDLYTRQECIDLVGGKR